MKQLQKRMSADKKRTPSATPVPTLGLTFSGALEKAREAAGTWKLGRC